MQSAVSLDRSCFDCSICLNLLNQPVSAPCGHSFCFDCMAELQRKVLYQAKCPLCGKNIPHVYFRTNLVLERLMSVFYPEEYSGRKSEGKPIRRPSYFRYALYFARKAVKTTLILGGLALLLFFLSHALLKSSKVNISRRVKWLLRHSKASCVWHLIWTAAHVLVRYIEATSILSGLSQ